MSLQSSNFCNVSLLISTIVIMSMCSFSSEELMLSHMNHILEEIWMVGFKNRKNMVAYFEIETYKLNLNQISSSLCML